MLRLKSVTEGAAQQAATLMYGTSTHMRLNLRQILNSAIWLTWLSTHHEVSTKFLLRLQIGCERNIKNIRRDDDDNGLPFGRGCRSSSQCGESNRLTVGQVRTAVLLILVHLCVPRVCESWNL